MLLVAQIAVGMIVNLYVVVPAHHPGAHPANYFSGSLRSIAWAIGHGAPALAIHASLGIAVVAIAIWVAIRAVKLRSGWVTLTSVFGAALVIGAGFNGASFVGFKHNVNSLIMALLALGRTSGDDAPDHVARAPSGHAVAPSLVLCTREEHDSEQGQRAARRHQLRPRRSCRRGPR
jgi:hypothetical protein